MFVLTSGQGRQDAPPPVPSVGVELLGPRLAEEGAAQEGQHDHRQAPRGQEGRDATADHHGSLSLEQKKIYINIQDKKQIKCIITLKNRSSKTFFIPFDWTPNNVAFQITRLDSPLTFSSGGRSEGKSTLGTLSINTQRKIWVEKFLQLSLPDYAEKQNGGRSNSADKELNGCI